MKRITLILSVLTLLAPSVSAFATVTPAPTKAAGADPDSVGFVDAVTSQYLFPTADGELASLYFGVPGDLPFLGDWDCDGIDTPGLYRVSDGYVYLRNSNSIGIADVRFYMGEPGDLPLVGDFDGNGCDTISVYRPGTGQVFVANRLGTDDGGIPAESSHFFGNPGDRPFTGDFDGDGATDIGLHRESSGLVYMRFSLSSGPADQDFFYGDPGDRIFAGDWDGDEAESVGLYRPADRTLYLSNFNRQQAADSTYAFGSNEWIPVAGRPGDLSSLEAVGAIDRPGVEVIDKAGWGSASTGQVVGHTIDQITIHHSASPFHGSNSDAPRRIRGFQRFHQDQGWPDIAYHFMVDRNGNVYEGRSLDGRGDTFTDYDPSGHLLIMVDGNFDSQEPTAAQVESLARLVAWGIDEYGIEPTRVGGHLDHASTSCPGEYLYEMLQNGTLAARIAQLRQGGVGLDYLAGEASTGRVEAVLAGTDPDPALVLLPVIPDLPDPEILARLGTCPGCATC